ncbi:MAG: 4Fe-4S binding protein [Spirochaetaceae bacterium]|nr:4Fe-4S binding protein [Spirochaetaceae bacterium]
MARRVDASICTNCGVCDDQCPVSIIVEKDGARFINDEAECIDCAACDAVCPVEAIKVV